MAPIDKNISSLSDREILLVTLTKVDHLAEKQEEFNKKLEEQDKKINFLMQSRNKIFGGIYAFGVITTLVNLGVLIANIVTSGK